VGWKTWFCGDISDELENCKAEEKYLRAQGEELTRELDRVKNKYQRCADERKEQYEKTRELYEKISKLIKDVAWYESRLKTLEKSLEDAIVIPDFEIDKETLTVVKPYGEEAFSGYDLRAADLEYYKFPYEKWVEMLAPVQREVKESLVRWKTSISDCDDWAYVMGATLTVAFAKAGLDKQGAFMILWSRSHAYNAFMDTDDNIWVYEPQNGTIVAKLEEAEEPYKTKMVWFPGAQP